MAGCDARQPRLSPDRRREVGMNKRWWVMFAAVSALTVLMCSPALAADSYGDGYQDGLLLGKKDVGFGAFTGGFFCPLNPHPSSLASRPPTSPLASWGLRRTFGELPRPRSAPRTTRCRHTSASPKGPARLPTAPNTGQVQWSIRLTLEVD